METPMNGAALSITHFSFQYPKAERETLQDITLSVKSGEFVVLCGPSGCGKTTLLRQCKTALAAYGKKSGAILLDNQPIETLSERDAAAKIGFVQQNPDNQIVTDKVWHELAFGPESLGYDTPTVRLRVAEMASFFGIQEWFYRSVSELSGGQKQLLALASVMVMQPSVLILDEPTAQLDPIAASEFLAAVGKINRELGVTVLITEHRLEEVFPFCSRVFVLDKGQLLCGGTPREVSEFLRKDKHDMFAAMPAPMRIWAKTKSTLPCPLTVREGREWLSQTEIAGAVPMESKAENPAAPTVELRDVWFKYGQNAPDVIKGLSFAAYAGEITAILGGNGTGKTTALSLISGLNAPYRGSIKINGQAAEKISQAERFHHLLSVLPQNPQCLFTAKTVEADLTEMLSESGLPKAERLEKVRKTAALCGLTELLNSHPYDLSGGEQQKAALAKVLLTEPKILLLDEPTKGFDARFKQTFSEILHTLTAAGVTVIMVSHDIEFCAEHADRCALFFDGSIVTSGTPRKFFSGNSFYTSSANRMARNILPEAVTVSDVLTAINGEPPKEASKTSLADKMYSLEKNEPKREEKPRRIAVRRGAFAAISALIFLLNTVYSAFFLEGFGSFLTGGSKGMEAAANPIMLWRFVASCAVFTLSAVAFFASLAYGRSIDEKPIQMPKSKRRLPKRSVAAAVMILLAIPPTVFIGIFYLGDRKYTMISLLIILESLLPFLILFEGRKPQARELVILAVLTALAVAGRAAFYMLPQFKPMAALVIISGIAFGGEAGFLVGAASAFLSNMLFGQGPWTPWQMFAFGLIGFTAGILFKKGVLRRSRAALCTFGGLATLLLYGGLMNLNGLLMFQPNPTAETVLAAYLQGIPFDLIHAFSTVVFLAVLAPPMLEKLDRVKQKYGLLEAK